MTNTDFTGDLHIKPEDMIVYVRIPGEAFVFDGQSEMDPAPTSRNREIMRAMLLDAIRTLDRAVPPVPSIPILPQITYPPAF